ncbi:hypothetical protein DD592_27655 [Enterobacter cloacae complex sp. 2DZ2F20B]|nr:hypothetical protein DD592_27655 [Enterobacter cloacae complex sp. 2DZ2F20B]
MDKLKNSSSKDIFDLNVVLIKTIKDIIITPLTRLINCCIRASVFPDCLKTARIIPIHKKGDRNDLNNYRPISILPVFSKIFEKVLHTQLYSYFEKNNLFSNFQYGFRK